MMWSLSLFSQEKSTPKPSNDPWFLPTIFDVIQTILNYLLLPCFFNLCILLIHYMMSYINILKRNILANIVWIFAYNAGAMCQQPCRQIDWQKAKIQPRIKSFWSSPSQIFPPSLKCKLNISHLFQVTAWDREAETNRPRRAEWIPNVTNLGITKN